MKTQIIKIGNSKGVRIPKPLLEQSELDGEVEFEVTDQGLLIRSSGKPRSGWAEAFRQMAEEEDDEMIIGDRPTAFERESWRW